MIFVKTNRMRKPTTGPKPARPTQNAANTIPRVATCIAFHARRRPDHIAVLRNTTPITYTTLHRHLAAVIHALRRQNLRPGATAAIGLDDSYTQLLLTFAGEAIGLTTAAFRPSEGQDAAALLAAADLVIAAQPPASPHKSFLHIPDSWLDTTIAAKIPPPKPLPPAPPGQNEAVFRSSGTTGAPKRMVLTHHAMRQRLRAQRHQTLGLGLTRTARYLAVMHFAVGSTYMAASNCLRLGATFICHTAPPGPALSTLPELLAAYQPTHLTILPFQLRGLVATIAHRATPLLPNLTVQTIGAKLPADLRHATLQTFAGRIIENYGTNEVGAIGAIDPSGHIRLLPGVAAKILAPDLTPLPPGEPGALHIRTPGMVHAYQDDPDATAAMFQNAHFVPGDIARLTQANTLTLVGRRNDILNLGGTKIAAAELEAKILAAAPVQDVALLQRSSEAASHPIIVCAVPAPNTNQPALESALTPLLPFPFRIRLLPAIPRTPEGKIRRTHLHDTLFQSSAPSRHPADN
jgi:acyl-coenzyme A synthetase/AMP-(fatty) acid ligase